MKAVRHGQDTCPASFDIVTHPNAIETVAIAAAMGVDYCQIDRHGP